MCSRLMLKHIHTVHLHTRSYTYAYINIYIYIYMKIYGDPGLNPGPDENFSLKLLMYDLPDGYSESQIFIKTCLYVLLT